VTQFSDESLRRIRAATRMADEAKAGDEALSPNAIINSTPIMTALIKSAGTVVTVGSSGGPGSTSGTSGSVQPVTVTRYNARIALRNTDGSWDEGEEDVLVESANDDVLLEDMAYPVRPSHDDGSGNAVYLAYRDGTTWGIITSGKVGGSHAATETWRQADGTWVTGGRAIRMEGPGQETLCQGVKYFGSYTGLKVDGVPLYIAVNYCCCTGSLGSGSLSGSGSGSLGSVPSGSGSGSSPSVGSATCACYGNLQICVLVDGGPQAGYHTLSAGAFSCTWGDPSSGVYVSTDPFDGRPLGTQKGRISLGDGNYSSYEVADVFDCSFTMTYVSTTGVDPDPATSITVSPAPCPEGGSGSGMAARPPVTVLSDPELKSDRLASPCKHLLDDTGTRLGCSSCGERKVSLKVFGRCTQAGDGGIPCCETCDDYEVPAAGGAQS
jgi:hypothetical protein